MVALDDLSLADLSDPRMQAIIRLLTRMVYRERRVAYYLESAGLNPGRYSLVPAVDAWSDAVPHAASDGLLQNLIDRVTEDEPAFGLELERQLASLASLRSEHVWYRHDNPYTSGFVGHGASRAVIDRLDLRRGLQALAENRYRILMISGEARSGKSHSWLMIDHLRNAGKLTGSFVRVTTHTWSGQVTGEDLVQSLIDKLGFSLGLTPSGELEDARIRKLLDLLVGYVVARDDGVTRWIILDGLDRPGVQNSARDAVKRLMTLVEDDELPRTKLIVTGLDTLGLTIASRVQSEQIRPIDRVLLRKFLADVARHLDRVVTDEELDARVADVLGTGGAPPDLGDLEEAVVRLVRKCWADGVRNGS
jgi:hypothetical protein